MHKDITVILYCLGLVVILIGCQTAPVPKLGLADSEFTAQYWFEQASIHRRNKNFKDAILSLNKGA